MKHNYSYVFVFLVYLVIIGFDPGFFQELICQARATGSSAQFGTFTMFNGSSFPTPDYELYSCPTNAGNTVGTRDPTLKGNQDPSTVIFTYRAPGTTVGDLQIR